ncbi:MAG: SH3 domain-containing protein [Anaerolineae bacterium]
MDIIAPIALIVAIFAGLGAAFMLWTGQTSARAGRGALFNTERQVAYDRAKRSRMAALALAGVSIALLLINLLGSGTSALSVVPTPTVTRTPRPTQTLSQATREVLIATLAATSTPTVQPQKAVVTGAGEPGLRLRATPNGQEIDFLKDGTVLEVLPDPQVKTDDGNTWQKVRDPQGREGWVAIAYIVFQ